MHVVLGAHKEQGHSSIANVYHDCAEFSRTERVLRTLVPQKEDDLDENMVMVSPKTFDKNELKNMMAHFLAPKLHHDFGEYFPPGIHKEVASDLIGKLLATGSTKNRHTLVITNESDVLEEELKVLKHLEAKGLVQSCLRGAKSSSWKMTNLGVASKRTCNTLIQPHKAIKARPSVPLSEWMTIEFVITLKKDGWHGELYNKKSLPEPYVVGDPKIFFVHPRAVRLNKFYLWALWTAPQHQKPVPHTITNDAYRQLILGKDYVPKQRVHRKADFYYESEMHSDLKPKSKTVRTRGRRIIAVASTFREGSIGSGASGGSSCSSDTSSSTSDSSSSSSSSSASDVDKDKINTDQVALQKREGGRILEHNQTWFGHRFTFCFRTHEASSVIEDAIGLEVGCNNKHVHGKKCRLLRNFKKYGGMDTLKYLCCKSWDVALTDQEKHRLMPIDVEEPPSPEEPDDSMSPIMSKRRKIDKQSRGQAREFHIYISTLH